MGIRRVLHPEWRDYNGPTKYPFGDTASLVNAAGDFIPETAFLDASLYPIGGKAGLYVSRVTIADNTVTITIGDPSAEQRCTGSFDLLTPPATVALADSCGRPAGMLVSEATRLSVFQAWSAGVHKFLETQTPFAAACCQPTPEIGVRGILLADGSVLTGDIVLVGDNGVVLTPVVDAERDHEVIRVDVVGDPLFRRKLCGDLFVEPVFLRTITVQAGEESVVCGPDVNGDFKITAGTAAAADSVLRIRSTPEGLVMEVAGQSLSGV